MVNRFCGKRIEFISNLFGIYRFLQGPETDPATVKKIRQAIDNQTEVTVQLINYTKSGRDFFPFF